MDAEECLADLSGGDPAERPEPDYEEILAPCQTLAPGDNKQQRRVWWHVNKSGFPVAEDTWETMWKHIADIHPDGAELVERIREAKVLPRVRFPYQPALRPKSSVEEQLSQIQRFLSALQYNHTGTQFFDIQKNRPLVSLMEKAKEIISASLPIKCLEAVIVALYLTRNIRDLDRFAISFKSLLKPHTHKHVVLGLYHNDYFGALGLSRRKTLMYKPLTFTSLCDLIEDYREAYSDCYHQLLTIKLSDVIPCDERSRAQIQWRHISVRLQDGVPLSQKARQMMTNFSRELHSQAHLAQKEARSAHLSVRTI